MKMKTCQANKGQALHQQRLPPSQKFHPGSIDHLDEGSQLAQSAIMNPTPPFKAIPRHESERLMDMGDGNMLMPIAMFEHYVYLMAYHRAYIYSFFMQRTPSTAT
jgi:hypothetical protein